MLYSSYVGQFYPGIVANSDAGVQESSWVNAPAVYSIKNLALKVGSQPMFQMNGKSFTWNDYSK
jgi:hypothetical protein